MSRLTPPGDVAPDRPESTRAWALRSAALAVLGAALWRTVGSDGLLLLPPVALAWLLFAAPVAFSVGQVLVLFELRRYAPRETLIVELALGTILLVSVLQRDAAGEPNVGTARRARDGLLFGGAWAGLAALGWVGSALTGRVAAGAAALVAGAALVGYAIRRRALAPASGGETP